MVINLKLPDQDNFTPMITVFGVGGAGCNAVNNMIRLSLSGVNFVVANTDAQSIQESICPNKIQLGIELTKGLGAGSYPEVGRASAEESGDIIHDYLEGNNMVFITAGMGGGTGSGAAPVIAKLAKERGILTVGVVTKPFHFEGAHRMRIAELGMQELQKYVDTLIVIPNQNLFRVADKKTTFLEAFKMADNVLYSGVRGITDLMLVPGLVNLDFADVRSIMGEMGKAMMGSGEATEEDRAIKAAEAAISNPLLDNVSMKGAKGVLINITGGEDMTLYEVDESVNRIRQEIDPEANIIFGSAFDTALNGKIRVSVVATGIEDENLRKAQFFSKSANEKNQENIYAEKNKFANLLHNKEKNSPNFVEDGNFIVPKAQVPEEDLESKSEVSILFNKMEDAENEKPSLSSYEDEDSLRKKKSGFLSGIFRKSSEDIDRLKPEEEEILGLNNPIPKESYLEKEVIIHNKQSLQSNNIEIPAFLRRKK